MNLKVLRTYFYYKLINIKDQDNKKFPNYENNLTIDDLVEIYLKYNGKCVFSGVKLLPYSKAPVHKKVSFDRIDNSLPHLKDNLQITSLEINLMRGRQDINIFKNKFNNKNESKRNISNIRNRCTNIIQKQE